MRINSLICKGLIAAVITGVLGGCYTTDADHG